MKVLVTGAAGHLGFNLVAALLAERPYRPRVRALPFQFGGGRSRPRRGSDGRRRGAARKRSGLARGDGRHGCARPYGRDLSSACTRARRRDRGGERGRRRRGITRRARRAHRAYRVDVVHRHPAHDTGGSPAVDENAWTTDLRVPYFRAKTLAERRAWELARELKLDLVTVLPGPFGGPGFVRNTPSIDVIEAIMKGAMRVAAPPVSFPYVDVRDVARAHVLALGSRASGRFIAIDEPVPTLAEIAHLMNAIDRRVPAPLMTLPAFTMLRAAVAGGARQLGRRNAAHAYARDGRDHERPQLQHHVGAHSSRAGMAAADHAAAKSRRHHGRHSQSRR